MQKYVFNSLLTCSRGFGFVCSNYLIHYLVLLLLFYSWILLKYIFYCGAYINYFCVSVVIQYKRMEDVSVVLKDLFVWFLSLNKTPVEECPIKTIDLIKKTYIPRVHLILKYSQKNNLADSFYNGFSFKLHVQTHSYILATMYLKKRVCD